MPYFEVKHRPDGFLQNSVKQGCPEELEEKFYGLVTFPIHKTLLGFLDKEVIGLPFESLSELREILDLWSECANGEQAFDERFGFSEIIINPEGFISCGEIDGKPFEIGSIESL